MKFGAPIASRTARVRKEGPQEAAAKELIGVEPRLDLRIEDVSTVPGGHRDAQYAAGRGIRARNFAGRRRDAGRRDESHQAAQDQCLWPSLGRGPNAMSHAS